MISVEIKNHHLKNSKDGLFHNDMLKRKSRLPLQYEKPEMKSVEIEWKPYKRSIGLNTELTLKNEME